MTDNNDLREQFILLMTKCSKYSTTFPSMCELPINALGILHMISENDDSGQDGIQLDMRSIQERLQISKPAISYNLNMLEEKDYIVREIDARDRRRISVHITPKGENAWELSMQRHEDLWNELMEDFGEADLKALTQLLARFFDVVDNRLAGGEI